LGYDVSEGLGTVLYFRAFFSPARLATFITYQHQTFWERDIKNALSWREGGLPAKKRGGADTAVDDSEKAPKRQKDKKDKKVAAGGGPPGNPAGRSVVIIAPTAPVLPWCDFTILDLLGMKKTNGEQFKCTRSGCTDKFLHFSTLPTKAELLAFVNPKSRGIMFDRKAEITAAIASLP
jgi:hypothetical protein